MSSDLQQQLEDLGHRLGEHGYQFRRAQYFADTGVLIYSPPVQHDEIAVIERSVFIYARDQRWEARVTLHGGPHWIREVDSIAQLEEAVLEALRSDARPPTVRWKIETS